MNNFDLHEQATQLSDAHSGYELARMLLQTQEELTNLKGNKLICDTGCAHQLSPLAQDLKFVSTLKDEQVTYNVIYSVVNALEKEIRLLKGYEYSIEEQD